MDLRTRYLGLALKNPIVPSASPLARHLDALRRMEDEGAAAVVLHSLFEEEILLDSLELERSLSYGSESFAEALSYFPDAGPYRTGPEAYLEHLRQAKEALAIPIIASLNGTTGGGWVRYAREMQQAGADAIELNMYFIATDPEMRSDQVEERYANLLVDVCREVSIPVAVKLSPFFSSIPYMVRRLTRAGAKGLVLFNRFYQPDIDIETLEVVPHLVLSDADDLRLPLRWIAILYGRVGADLALTSGVHSAEGVLKGLMAGASVTMMTSELLQSGVGRIGDILADLSHWLEEHEYGSVDQLKGSMSQINCPAPETFERANYMKVLASYAVKQVG